MVVAGSVWISRKCCAHCWANGVGNGLDGHNTSGQAPVPDNSSWFSLYERSLEVRHPVDHGDGFRLAVTREGATRTHQRAVSEKILPLCLVDRHRDPVYPCLSLISLCSRLATRNVRHGRQEASPSLAPSSLGRQGASSGSQARSMKI